MFSFKKEWCNLDDTRFKKQTKWPSDRHLDEMRKSITFKSVLVTTGLACFKVLSWPKCGIYQENACNVFYKKHLRPCSVQHMSTLNTRFNNWLSANSPFYIYLYQDFETDISWKNLQNPVLNFESYVSMIPKYQSANDIRNFGTSSSNDCLFGTHWGSNHCIHL